MSTGTRLSVCCVTADPGPRVREILQSLREAADEIVIAADVRAGAGALREFAAVADRVFEVEFPQFVEQALPWLHAQCSGDWILRLDGDEVPSAELLRELPALIEANDVVQYFFPRRWLFPDERHWLFEWPWWPDFQNRLVRNDPLLWVPGLLHTANAPELPARYLEAAIYHLDTALHTEAQRQAKIERYSAIDPALREPAGDRLMAHYYLPELYATSDPVSVSAEDQRIIAGALTPPPVMRSALDGGATFVSAAQIARHWPLRTISSDAYRASLTPIDSYRRLVASEHRPFRVAVRNESNETWPGGEDRQPVIRVAYRWKRPDGSVVVADSPRGAFPAPVAPGAEAIVPLRVIAPEEPGEYVLEVDVVHEFVRWFESPFEVTITVRPRSAAEPRRATRWRHNASEMARRWFGATSRR